MLSIGIAGSADLSERLSALPDQLRGALAEKVELLAQALYAQVVGVNLSGGLVNARSGALRDSIELDVQQDDAGIGARIASNGDVPYAAILEYGGKTAAHEILPDKAQALAFLLNGKQVFARRIQHPGSNFEARSYLRSALADASDDIASSLAGVVIAAAEQLKES